MNKISKVLVTSLLGASLVLGGCAQTSTSTIGNGQVDPVEAATIQLSVGTIMAAYPKTIVPALQVTSALLAIKNNTTNIVELNDLDILLKAETAKLNLDPLTLQSFNDLIVLVKASINQKLESQGVILDNEKLVVAWKVVEIVNNTAKARIYMLDKRMM